MLTNLWQKISERKSCSIMLIANFLPIAPILNPTFLNWVVQVPFWLRFLTKFEPSPAVRYLANIDDECVSIPIILVSVTFQHFACRSISPRVSNPLQICSQHASCSIMLNANFIPRKPDLSSTNLHIEQWSTWVTQVPAALMNATNPEPSPIVWYCYCLLSNMETQLRM